MNKLYTLFILSTFLLSSQLMASLLLVGTGISDITGPPGEIAMMGYAVPKQKTNGIHIRIWSRAFILVNPQTQKRIVIVSNDLGMITQSLKLKVVNELKKVYGDELYTDENVMLSATHTHSGPGGYSHYTLYNITSLGFSQLNFDLITSGIVEAIRKAHNNLENGSAFFIQSQLHNSSQNRSLVAYRANHDAGHFEHSTNKVMTQLNLVNESNDLVGIMNWFPVHATNMSNKNKFISGDNKGIASYLLEKLHGTNYNKYKTFVGAFFNAEEGDVTPNTDELKEKDEFEKTYIIGTRHFNKSLDLLNDSFQSLMANDVDYRHVWVDMPKYEFDNKKLCKGAMGFSFAAGAEDGPSEIPGFYEGMKQGDDLDMPRLIKKLSKIFAKVIGNKSALDDVCHYPKPVLISSGSIKRNWTPSVLPFQIFRIGNLAILGVPAELTTMSGRRLKNTVLDILHPIGVEHVIISGLSNTYSGYVTTLEEYNEQHYEGASTLFGPNTFGAYVNIFSKLATSIVARNDVPSAPRPRLKSDLKSIFKAPYDDKRLWEKFGKVIKDVKGPYAPGSSVTVSFRAGHPNNNPRQNFIDIQRLENGQWINVATDKNIDTLFKWYRKRYLDCLLCSTAKITWKIPEDTPPGVYRIRHQGFYRPKLRPGIRPYEGVSATFQVQ